MRNKVILPSAHIMFLLLVSITLISGCFGKNPKKIKIEKEDYFEDIENVHGLTFGECRMLIAYNLRSGMEKSFQGKSTPVTGKTLGEIIEAQRKWEADRKQEVAEEEKIAQEAKKRYEDLRKELRRTIMVTVVEKLFEKSDYRAGHPNDSILFRCECQNLSNKKIRAFTGAIRFTDLFGSEISFLRVTISDPIEANAKINWVGGIDFNQFMDEHVRLRNTSLENMKVIWEPKSILFSDGTQIGEKAD